MARVEIENIDKNYGAVKILKDISISVKDGEFLVLVGPSGCGKSTLLRMIAGLENISAGEIYIGDRIVNNLPPKERDVSMVFQNYALYPHLTVAENIGFSLILAGTPKAEKERLVHDAADVLGLSDLLERKPKNLSGGQRQRVAMGRAIIRRPKAFLFDEPLSNLDAKLRVAMRAEIKSLHERSKTTAIYVTHDQVEAMTMVNRIVVMNEGRIERISPPPSGIVR
jgi:multiple sugar transport system ATP-binding protein